MVCPVQEEREEVKTAMSSKPSSGFFGRHQVILPSDSGKEAKWCTKKNRYYCNYVVGDKRERHYLEATTQEEATKERDILFTRLCMQGAIRRGERVSKKRILKDKLDLNHGITEFALTVKRYKVIVDKKYLGTRRTLGAARDLRDKYMEENALAPCATCGKRPVLAVKGTHWSLDHVEAGCLNIVKIRRIGKVEASKKWNTILFKQKPFEI